MCSVQIYIISLPSAAERRDHIQQQFANSRHSF
ncbi:glycosyltransferase family 25 protein, partial [Vibrio parahaemolyticus]